VQTKRRYDLIPNLVETVKGYATHERETFERVIQARNTAQAATGPADQAQAENLLTGALRQLFALAEAYPELRASENFQGLQAELSDTENKIAVARQIYNDAVLTYNNAVQVAPGNIIAGIFNFGTREFFDAPEQAAEPPKVEF
jgi:LemA protein